MKTSERVETELEKYTENTAKSATHYSEYEEFSSHYNELMASGFTKPRESRLRSVDTLLNDVSANGSSSTFTK